MTGRRLAVLEESAVPIEDGVSVLEPKLDCLIGDECSAALDGTCGLGVFPVRLFSDCFPLLVTVDPVHNFPAGTLTGPMLPKLRFVASIG